MRGPLGDLAESVAEGSIPERGEFVLVVGMVAAGGGPTDRPGAADALAAARTEVDRLVAGGVARGDAARRVAAATGIPRRQLYGAIDAGGAAATRSTTPD